MIRKVLAKYTKPGEAIHNKVVRYVYGSPCSLAIVPVFDILGLDDRARLNTPGTVGSPNWEWCLESFDALMRKKNWVRDVITDANR